MSGGVDSSVAAALLAESGHDVVGVTLHLWDAQGEHQVGRCCAPEDRDDARRSCEHIGMPHYVVDERVAFRELVVEPFMDAYRSGQTPSPCVHCNRTVKLDHLLDIADRFGCSHVATGHYARLRQDAEGTRLLRGRDLHKDQSYFLFGVPQRTLARLLFPLGERVKDDSRAEARRLGLPNAAKPDSQELCFVPDGDVAGFVRRERGDTKAGRIVSSDGRTLGEHQGIEGFTVGQRKGLGLGGGPARYVLRILPQSGDVVVGQDAELMASHLEAHAVTWSHEPPTEAFEATVRVRYRHAPAPAAITPTAEGFKAHFTSPQRAITAGQAAVVYRGDEVVGGGFIQ